MKFFKKSKSMKEEPNVENQGRRSFLQKIGTG